MNGSIDTLLDPASHDAAIGTVVLGGAVLVALVFQRILFAGLLRLAKRGDEGVFAKLVHRAEGPASFAVPLLVALIVLPELTFPRHVAVLLGEFFAVATVIAIAWGVIASIGLYTDLVKRRYKLDVEDNLRARQVATRIDILSRSIITIVVIVATALAAMTFPQIRSIGTALLASAGVAGLVIGLAARPLFENLVAGIQIALTQPIRIDDVVIVEKEYGHIESIGATYVVVRVWDQRRIVLPLTYFITTPFENWTRTGSALVGSVFVFTDYTVPVAAVRDQVPRILAESTLWDGAVQNVQVTEATPNAMQLRILVSARNSAMLFDLRCEMREKLIAWIAATYPGGLPVQRVDQHTVVTS